MKEYFCTDPYQALANAIIELAVRDYKVALKQEYKHSCAKAEAQSLERFFRSAWFETLTELDGEYLISGVRSMVRKEVEV